MPERGNHGDHAADAIHSALAVEDGLQQLCRTTLTRPDLTPAEVDLVLASLASAVAALPQAVTLGGRRVPVTRPWVPAVDGTGEVPVAAYELFNSTEILGRMAIERMLAGVSTRRYPIALEPVEGRPRRPARRPPASRRSHPSSSR